MNDAKRDAGRHTSGTDAQSAFEKERISAILL